MVKDPYASNPVNSKTNSTTRFRQGRWYISISGKRLMKLAMSALVVGLDLLMRYCKKLKYVKNIILITDGLSKVDWTDSEDIIQQINQENINLSVLYVR